MTPTAPTVTDRVQAAILARVAGGVVLIGTADTLARTFDGTVTVFLSALRELLEAYRITVQIEPHGQLSVRLNYRSAAPADRPV